MVRWPGKIAPGSVSNEIMHHMDRLPTLRAWIEPWTPLRVPLITNLRRDPYERAHVTSHIYYDWMIDRVFFLVPGLPPGTVSG
jgi:hypothetical protein